MRMAIIAGRSTPGLLTGLLAATACSSTGPGAGRIHPRPALLSFYGAVTEVQIPITVQADVPFAVTATSFGGGCRRLQRAREAVADPSPAPPRLMRRLSGRCRMVPCTGGFFECGSEH